MSNKLALSIALFSSFAFAEPIITETEKVNDLSKKSRENKTYLKYGPIKFEIFQFQLGSPLTPYYVRGANAKRFYRKDNKCFEVTILDTVNIARKMNCYDKTQDLFLEGFEDFKVIQIKDLIAEEYKSFKVFETAANYELMAFVQPYDVYSMDLNVYGPQVEQRAPKKKFQVHYNSSSDVVLAKGVLELKQLISLKVEKIGIMPEKTTQSTSTIGVTKGGLVFSNGRGEVLIYNPNLRKPFEDYELVANEKLPQYLGELEEQSLNAPVCFRDNYLSPGPNDCHKMIFETHAKGYYKKVKIVAIDFAKKMVRFIE